MEEEKRKVEKILKEQEEKERLYNEKMLFFLLDLERMVMLWQNLNLKMRKLNRLFQ